MAWHAVKQRKSTQKKNQEQITLTLTAQRFGLERAGTNARPLDGGALNLVGTRTPANGRAAAPSSAPATSRCNSCAPCGRAQRTEKIIEKKKKRRRERERALLATTGGGTGAVGHHGQRRRALFLGCDRERKGKTEMS